MNAVAAILTNRWTMLEAVAYSLQKYAELCTWQSQYEADYQPVSDKSRGLLLSSRVTAHCWPRRGGEDADQQCPIYASGPTLARPRIAHTWQSAVPDQAPNCSSGAHPRRLSVSVTSRPITRSVCCLHLCFIRVQAEFNGGPYWLPQQLRTSIRHAQFMERR